MYRRKPPMTKVQALTIRQLRRNIEAHYGSTSKFRCAWTKFEVKHVYGSTWSLFAIYGPVEGPQVLQALRESFYHFFIGPKGGISTYWGRPDRKGKIRALKRPRRVPLHTAWYARSNSYVF